MNETDLHLELIGSGNAVIPFSGRECTQTLSPISQGALRRTINGILVYVGNKEHQKFQSTIFCKDKTAPAFGAIWEGTLLRVRCIQTLTHLVNKLSESVPLERDAFSVHLHEYSGKIWETEMLSDKLVKLPPKFPGGFLTYRPLLKMVVKHYSLETDEWGLSVGWKLELEEE